MSLVTYDRTAKGGTELIALEGRSGTLIEIIWRVESIVADKLVSGSVDTVVPDWVMRITCPPGACRILRRKSRVVR